MVNLPYIYTIFRKKQVFVGGIWDFLSFSLQKMDSRVYLSYNLDGRA